MEYSIGFFGGAGMAYGTFTSEWEDSGDAVSRKSIIAPIIILTLLIPFFVWDQSFGTERLIETIKGFDPIADAAGITNSVQWVALLLVIAFAGLSFYKYYSSKPGELRQYDRKELQVFFFGNLGLYTVYSLLITCAFMSLYRIEQYLYIVNLIIIGFLINKFQPSFSNRGLNVNRWVVNFLFVMALFAILTAVAVSSHGELKGANSRFE
jgi:hypothetical protein